MGFQMPEQTAGQPSARLRSISRIASGAIPGKVCRVGNAIDGMHPAMLWGQHGWQAKEGAPSAFGSCIRSEAVARRRAKEWEWFHSSVKADGDSRWRNQSISFFPEAVVHPSPSGLVC
jgi:hypothetical protein